MPVRTTASLLLILATVSACGGSGGEEVTTPPPSLPDITGEEVSVTSATYRPGQGADIADGMTITLDSGFLTGGPLDAELELFGETVTVTNGSGRMSDGKDVAVIYEEDRAGQFVAPIEVTVFDATGGVFGETGLVVGTETPASDIPSGTATYTGDFLAIGQIVGAEAEYQGAISLDVDFSGNVDGTLNGDVNDSTNVILSLDAASVSENGFSGDLICTSGCTTSASSLDATFYGPSAEEIGGVTALEFDQFEGVGTFIATDD
ncbi:transferrin-binding protein-like solute binding protein [Loktanella sp. S4079]|uniref:transferrin-binding protein-like solute binding protein n=1 Tax=Loktanella sp. S4079 TaxID=579483 RepID=UPI0005FA62FC|nr:transferrin-binding protein-like solute binding protein [Loktanella sp. S4079]KJZ20039.1 hypothetical protein TW80_04110 [Loktanella sp. S4079]